MAAARKKAPKPWKKLTISGVEWSLYLRSEAEDPDLAGRHAYTDADALTIVFNKSSPPELLASLFIHELVHAVLVGTRGNALRAVLGIPAEGWDVAEEELAEFFGQALFDALSRNGLLKLPKFPT